MNHSMGYTSFELDFESVANMDRRRSSSPKNPQRRVKLTPMKKSKKICLRKMLLGCIPKRPIMEFEFIPKKPITLAEKMVKVRAERADIQRRLAALEKKAENRRLSKGYEERDTSVLDTSSPMKMAMVQKVIIQRRLARRVAAQSS